MSLPIRYVSIEEECKRNPQLRMSDLQMLKDWMEKQPHLPRVEMLYLVMFLHSNYYRIEPTKKTIDNFYTIRTLFPEVFSNRDPIAWKELRKAFSVLACTPLEQKTKEGYIMTFGKIRDPNPNKYNFFEAIKYVLMTCEVQNITHGTSEGQIIILDATGLTFGHIAAINLMGVKRILFYIQEAAPVRLKAIHVLNTVPIVDTLMNLLRPFIKKELVDILHFHSSMATAKKYLPIEGLPNEYNGKAGPLEEITAKHIKLLEEFRDWFQYDEIHRRVNESLRVGKCKSAESLFGVDGSFKKLELDSVRSICTTFKSIILTTQEKSVVKQSKLLNKATMSIMKTVTLEEEMGKNPQLKLSDIQLLKEWCEKQPHLPKIEDSFLALFLHSNYYQMEPTKSTIENYYTMRTHLPEFFCNRDPLANKELRQAFKIQAILPLNGTTKDGYRMIYGTLMDSDPSNYDFNNSTKYSTMIMDLYLLMNGITDSGFSYIVDMGKLSFGHMTRMNPLGMKKSLYFVQEAAPIRLKGMHIINMLPGTELLINMMKPFMKKEMINMMHFHSSLESLSEYIPVDALPNEVGGKAGFTHELAEIQVKLLEDYREWFLLDERTGRVNEALRIGKSKSANDLFGVEGSFKKLDID
ncbi:PREDICTED: uncharacterized protein LOC105561954 [Vollenhovia emeryi]|uniref:uncharacterized protein LOC105561954 n=1 Tax=Vollenhovia emeryi TaxID=411798 RepID=UPI0005F41087|nr:PREDICTED: uncharacterized protein LOC105561954 [Vollenhovia emeryi]